MFRKLTLTLALALCAAAAFALPKPSEVRAAVDSGNYQKAESLLQEVLQEKPSARAHYDLGQVYAKEGKHAQAVNELRQAQALDPSVKFASNAATFTQILTNEQTLAAPPANVVAPSVVYAAPRAAVPSAPDHTLLFFFLGLLMVGGGVGAYFLLASKKEAWAAQDAQTADQKQKTSTLLGFAKQLEDALLIAKTATYSDAMKTQVTGRITALQTSVRNALADIKDGKGCTSGRLSSLQGYVDQAVNEAQNGVVATAAPTATVDSATGTYATRSEANVYQGQPDATTQYAPARPSFAPSPTQSIFHHYPTPAPAPVVVNNSNDGLLTGVLIGEMLSNHHEDRTVYVERERPIDTPRYQRDEYVAPAPAPAARDDDDSYSSSSSSSYDSGSSSSDSYSSDSSSSMDSSSSSSDSY